MDGRLVFPGGLAPDLMMCPAALGQRWDTPDLTRTSMYDTYSGSTKSLHACVVLVIVKQHLVQISLLDGPTENLSYILAAIRSRDSNESR